MTERADLVWHAGRHITATVRGLPLVYDKPVEKGYTNFGATPSEVFLASLAACTLMSTLRVAEVRKVPLTKLAAQAELEFDAQDRVSLIRVRFDVESAGSREDWEVIARLAGKFCTLEQLTKPPVEKVFVLNGKDTVKAAKAD